jgi:hypothetical protein
MRNLLLIIIGTICLSSNGLFAQTQCGNTKYIPGSGTATVNKFGQSFKICATSPSKLVSIEIRFKAMVNSVKGTLKIYSGEGIGGNVLHTQSVTLKTTAMEQSVVIPITAMAGVLEPGQNYTFYIETGRTQPIAHKPNPYSNGQAYNFNGISTPEWDFWFLIVTEGAASCNGHQSGNNDQMENFVSSAGSAKTVSEFGQSFLFCPYNGEPCILRGLTIRFEESTDSRGTLKLYKGEGTATQPIYISTEDVILRSDADNADCLILTTAMSEVLVPGEKYTYYITVKQGHSPVKPSVSAGNTYGFGRIIGPNSTPDTPLDYYFFYLDNCSN